MNNRNDEKWQQLLAQSTSTFEGSPVPPYGFMTRALAQLQSEKREVDEYVRIGWRALIASVVALVVVFGVTAGLQLAERNDLEPGVRSVIAVANLPIS